MTTDKAVLLMKMMANPIRIKLLKVLDFNQLNLEYLNPQGQNALFALAIHEKNHSTKKLEFLMQKGYEINQQDKGKNIWNENGEIKKIINEIKQSPIRLTYQFEKGHSNNKWNNVAHKLSRVGRGFNEEKFINVSA